MFAALVLPASGAALCRRMAALGAKVVVADLHEVIVPEGPFQRFIQPVLEPPGGLVNGGR